jgi:hypothetical protein
MEDGLIYFTEIHRHSVRAITLFKTWNIYPGFCVVMPNLLRIIMLGMHHTWSFKDMIATSEK